MNIFVQEPHLSPQKPTFINKIKSSFNVITQTVTQYVRTSSSFSKQTQSDFSGLGESNPHQKDEALIFGANRTHSPALNDQIPQQRTSLLKKGEKKEVISLTKVLNTVEDYKNGFMPDLQCYQQIKKYPMKCFQIPQKQFPTQNLQQIQKTTNTKITYSKIKQKQDRKKRRQLIKNRYLLQIQNKQTYQKQSQKYLNSNNSSFNLKISQIINIKQNKNINKQITQKNHQNINKTIKKTKPTSIPLQQIIKLPQPNLKPKTHQINHQTHKEIHQKINHSNNTSNQQFQINTSIQINQQLSQLKSAIQNSKNIQSKSQNSQKQSNPSSKPKQSNQQESELPLLNTIKKNNSNPITSQQSQSKSQVVIEQTQLKQPKQDTPKPATQTPSTNPFLIPTSGLNLKDLIANGFKNPTNQLQIQNSNLFQNPIQTKNPSEPIKPHLNINLNLQKNFIITNNPNNFETNNKFQKQTQTNNKNEQYNFSKIAQQFTNSLNSSSYNEIQFTSFNNYQQSPQQTFQYNPNTSKTFQPHLQPQQQTNPQSHFQITQSKFNHNPQPLSNYQSNFNPINLFIDSSKPSLFQQPVSRTEKKSRARTHRGAKQRIH